ncbi:SDR family NAD(P)-dependent oxidoreductase [Meiothermus sp.]|uniref:SDR family NAD(P)-dependent oxidoreductase n=1 Tax=Meiothermus sp. TaxID=1955249 RepID=UPI0021DF373D|nr:SDR family NAD(P)-dependent oxidoreductase [Meiothermus sp.]GIW26357.1 MAG: epimerase [Meiothermus sp.]
MSFSRFILSPPSCRSLERLSVHVQGKTVLITGASFGIGEATALLLARAGAEVLLIARTAGKLEQLVRQIEAQGGKATAYPADLYQTAEIPALMSKIQVAHPRIDIVVSNAGKSIRRRVVESFGRNDLERSVVLNFLSPAAMLMELLPRMMAQGGGQIINVSTVSARQPAAPRWGTYQSSKAGFDIWLRSLANELRPYKILVSSVYMPLVRTRMSAASGLYERWPALTPLEAAQVIAYAIVRPVDRVAPWWLWPSEVLALFLMTPVHRVLTYLDHRMPR